MLDETICIQHEYCTNCPERAKCPKRITFYNKNQFCSELLETDLLASSILETMDFPANVIAISSSMFLEMMIKKRNRELEEYPIYSPV